MYTPRGRARIACGVIAASIFAACTSDQAVSNPVLTSSETVTMCRTPKTAPFISNVAIGDVPAHRAQGEYVTHLVVDPSTTSLGDSIHFKRITDAVSLVRAVRRQIGDTLQASCAIQIDVAAGTYKGTTKSGADPSLEQLPIVLDVPGVTLQGALVMTFDSAGRATGNGQTSANTTIVPSPGLVTNPIPEVVFLVEGHANGSAGNDITIQGFDLQSGHVGVDADSGGYGVFSVRVKNLIVRGNKFEPTLTSALDLRASTANVNGNWVSGGMACDICLAGPGDYTARNNKVVQGGIDGIAVSATVVLPVPTGADQIDSTGSASVHATVANNEVRDHMRLPVGVGIRAAAVAVGAPNMAQSTSIEIDDNLLVHNMFGLLVEAGFPVANTLLKGDITASLSGNIIQSSCQTDLMVTFNRHATTVGAAQLTRPYLRNSTYVVSLNGNLDWNNVWYSEVPNLGETLIVDGASVPPGSRLAYDQKKACP
jgi:hypothetical protein